MARQIRIEMEGGIYHVMARGDRREPIFHGDEDRWMFLRTLGEACERCGWRVHAWVLMSNHYHLLLETPLANLVAGMGWLQNTFTIRFSRRHRPGGHVFGGRYKAVVVEGPPQARPALPTGRAGTGAAYFSTVMDYIHLNPVRARLVTPRTAGGLAAYRWSSLVQGYLQPPGKRARWLEVKRGFEAAGINDRAAGRRQWLERLEDRMREEKAELCGVNDVEGLGLWTSLRRGWCFGSEGFRESLRAKAALLLARKPAPQEAEASLLRLDHARNDGQRLIKEGWAAMGLPEKGEAVPASDVRRVCVAAVVKAKTAVPLAWLAEQVGITSAANVSEQVRRLPDRLKRHPQIKRLYEEWKNSLS